MVVAYVASAPFGGALRVRQATFCGCALGLGYVISQHATETYVAVLAGLWVVALPALAFVLGGGAIGTAVAGVLGAGLAAARLTGQTRT